MPSSRDVGGRDFENTVTVPGPLIRSRHPQTEDAGDHHTEHVEEVDELRCPECDERFPGFAVRCPHDDSELTARL